jgi:hypothetical protein
MHNLPVDEVCENGKKNIGVDVFFAVMIIVNVIACS